MKTIKTTVYNYNELSDEAKETALDWLLEASYNDCYHYIDLCEDAKTIGLQIIQLSGHRANEGEFIISAIECSEAILNNHGADCATYKTAQAFDAAIDALPELPSDDADDYNEVERRLCESVDAIEADFLRSLLEDYRIILEKDNEYHSSREYLEEIMVANEYTFTETGKRFG